MEADGFVRLNVELNEARKAYQKAQTEATRYDEMLKTLPPGHPDATEALRLANKQLRESWKRYQEALEAFAEYNRKGSGPTR
jgi:alkylhydroperoxidase/carboxymuconolactone decarboxylase family protein YurZ